MKKFIQNLKNRITSAPKATYRRVVTVIERRPFTSFFIVLFLLVFFIILGNFLRTPKITEKKEVPVVKNVRTYSIGAAPKIILQAQVEKSGVVTITALTPGVVQSIPEPGQKVTKGQVLVSLSTNYQGGNALSLQRQIAQTQLKNVNDTYPTQLELIQKQREVAEKTNTNAEQLREISRKSIDESKALIGLNDQIITTIDQQLKELEETNTGGVNDPFIMEFRLLKAQVTGGNNQLKSALRNTEYSSSEDNPPAQLGDLQKEITLKNLEIQEKSLALNREVSKLQAQIANVNEAMMFPSSPFAATVQRVNVKVGQAVQPGTPLVILSQNIEEDPIVAIAYAPREVAQKVSTYEPSRLYIGDTTYDAYPSYITQDAIQGSLYGIYFPIPDMYHRSLTEKGYIQVEVPIGVYDTLAEIPFIPLDSVYQSQTEAYVFVINKGKAVARRITLGQVFGRYVHVESGLQKGDIIILDRNIVGGDNVKAIQ